MRKNISCTGKTLGSRERRRKGQGLPVRSACRKQTEEEPGKKWKTLRELEKDLVTWLKES